MTASALSDSSGRRNLFEVLWEDTERAFLHFASHVAAHQKSDEPGQAIEPSAVDHDEPEPRSPRRIRDEDTHLEGTSKIVTRVNHL